MLMSIALATALLFSGGASGQTTDLYVVVNASNPVRTLSTREVLELFTGRSRAFADGRRAQPFDHARDSAPREAFYQLVAGSDLARINSYWARLQFSGQVQPPRPLQDDEAIAQAIRRDAGGIGYLTQPPNDPNLRVVLVVKRSS
jgi:ABC-type phosphate transport system substrate-binding protein